MNRTGIAALVLVLTIGMVAVGCGAAGEDETADASRRPVPNEFWGGVRAGSSGVDGVIGFTSLEQLLPGRSPTDGVFGPVQPVEAVVLARPVAVRAGIAFGPSGDTLDAPVVDFDAADAVFRWVFIDLEVDEVIAGDVDPGGVLTVEVPLGGLGSHDRLGQMKRSVADAGSGVFFISAFAAASVPADRVLDDGMAYRVAVGFTEDPAGLESVFVDASERDLLVGGPDVTLDELVDTLHHAVEVPSVRIVVTPSIVPADRETAVSITMANDTDAEVMHGVSARLERRVGGKWKPVGQVTSDDIAESQYWPDGSTEVTVPAVGFTLRARESGESASVLIPALDAGTYRLVRELSRGPSTAIGMFVVQS